MWHRSFGHLRSSYLSNLNTQETHTNLDVPESVKSCEEFDLSKATKLPHTDKPQSIIDEEREKSLRKGLIHSDVMGPIKSK